MRVPYALSHKPPRPCSLVAITITVEATEEDSTEDAFGKQSATFRIAAYLQRLPRADFAGRVQLVAEYVIALQIGKCHNLTHQTLHASE